MNARQTPIQTSISNFVQSACEIARGWHKNGQLTEAIDFLTILTTTAPMKSAPESHQAKLWADLGKLQAHNSFFNNTHFDGTIEILNKAQQLAESSDCKGLVAQALQWRGFVLNSRVFHGGEGKYEDALPDSEQALHLREDLEDFRGLAESLVYTAIIYERLQQTEKAKASYERALALSQAHELPAEESYALRHLAFMRQNEGDLEGALDYFKQSLELREALEMKINLPLSYSAVGHVCLELQQFEDALEYLNQALESAEQLDVPRVASIALYLLGETQVSLEQVVEAIESFEKSLKISESLNYQAGIDRAQTRIEALKESTPS